LRGGFVASLDLSNQIVGGRITTCGSYTEARIISLDEWSAVILFAVIIFFTIFLVVGVVYLHTENE